MKTPKLVEVIREHFNCSSLAGLELEDVGGAGTAGSHWKRRVIFNEYMSGESAYDPVFSIFTFALLEDSGWYFPNYAAADPFYWGLNAGCSFAMDRCDQRTRPYNCDPVRQYMDEDCSHDWMKKGKCNIGTYTSVPSNWDPWYNIYGNDLVHGNDPLADYCGFIRYDPSYFGDCTVSQFNNISTSAQYRITNYGEVYSPSSRCLTARDNFGITGPSCQNMTCVNGMLKIRVGLSWYNCTQPGQMISITGYNGYYLCPKDLAYFCNSVPNDNSTWPSFVSVSPQIGKLGDVVVITASGLTSSNLVVYIGADHGCSQTRMQVTFSQGIATIMCTVGANYQAFTLHGNNLVDVVIVDDQARTATGLQQFTLSGASSLFTGMWMLSLIVWFL